MTTYQAESFYRAKITSSITSTATVPITVRVSKLPTLTNALLTISPNTEFEEIVEYNNPNATTMTIDIIKRGINPSSVLLTSSGTDYNNPTYQKDHTQNDIIRWDVNHIHINQGIGNTTLATNLGVGISKLSVAAANPSDPIVVWDNDPRLWARIAVGRIDLTSATTTLTTYNIWFRPKMVRLTWTWWSTTGPTSTSVTYDWGSTYTTYAEYDQTSSPSVVRFRHDSQNWSAVLLRNVGNTNVVNIVTVGFVANWFTLSGPLWTWISQCSITYEAFA